MHYVVVSVCVASVAWVVSIWLLTRTLNRLNIVIATSSEAEPAVSEKELEEQEEEVATKYKMEPAPLGQLTYEGATEMLEAQL